MESNPSPLVGIVMGSVSDWPVMENASKTLAAFGLAHECRVLSAHRSPDAALEYARTAEVRGLKVLIAAAGMAAHLAGVLAAKTHIPVLGVPMESKPLLGMDALLSMVQMPPGIPVATFAIGKAGAVNAALFAVSLLALENAALRQALLAYRENQTRTVLSQILPPAITP